MTSRSPTLPRPPGPEPGGPTNARKGDFGSQGRDLKRVPKALKAQPGTKAPGSEKEIQTGRFLSALPCCTHGARGDPGNGMIRVLVFALTNHHVPKWHHYHSLYTLLSCVFMVQVWMIPEGLSALRILQECSLRTCM